MQNSTGSSGDGGNANKGNSAGASGGNSNSPIASNNGKSPLMTSRDFMLQQQLQRLQQQQQQQARSPAEQQQQQLQAALAALQQQQNFSSFSALSGVGAAAATSGPNNTQGNNTGGGGGGRPSSAPAPTQSPLSVSAVAQHDAIMARAAALRELGFSSDQVASVEGPLVAKGAEGATVGMGFGGDVCVGTVTAVACCGG